MRSIVRYVGVICPLLFFSATLSWGAGNWWIEYYGGTKGDSFTDGLMLEDGYIGCGSTTSFLSVPGQTRGAYIVRTDRQGELLWQRNISRLDNVVPTRIFRREEGGFIVVGTGFDKSSPRNGDIWLATFDDNGNKPEEVLIRGAERFTLMAVVRLDDGSFVAGGSRTSIRSTDPDTLALVRFTGEGTILWQRPVPNGAEMLLQSLIRTTDGHLVASGNRWPKYRDSLANSYLFALRLTSDGDVALDRRYHVSGPINCASTAELPDGGLVLVGNKARYDTTTGTIVDNKGLLISIDRDGTTWSEPVIDELFTICNDVTVDDRGTVLVAGTGTDTVEKIVVPRTVPALARYTSTLAPIEGRTFADLNITFAAPTRIISQFDRIAVFGRTNLNGFLFSMAAAATLSVEEFREGVLDLK